MHPGGLSGHARGAKDRYLHLGRLSTLGTLLLKPSGQGDEILYAETLGTEVKNRF